jgi:hypothetical protein
MRLRLLMAAPLLLVGLLLLLALLLLLLGQWLLLMWVELQMLKVPPSLAAWLLQWVGLLWLRLAFVVSLLLKAAVFPLLPSSPPRRKALLPLATLPLPRVGLALLRMVPLLHLEVSLRWLLMLSQHPPYVLLLMSQLLLM